MSILEIRQLTVRFGGLTAVNALDLQIPPNVIASVIGPNGAGKTTVFNAITGIYEPTAGCIVFNDEEPCRKFGPKTALMLALVGIVTALLLILAVDIEPLWETAITGNYQFHQPFPWMTAIRSDRAYFAEGLASRLVLPLAIGFLIGIAGAFAVWQRSRRAPQVAAPAGI